MGLDHKQHQEEDELEKRGKAKPKTSPRGRQTSK